DAAVSPADGKVVSTSHMDDPFTGEKRRTICVFMNVFNVHVNRMPVSGRVEKISYFPGRFVNASLDKASTLNERCAWLLRDEQDRTWTMVQIAGLVARRIVPLAEKGDTVARGDRYGLIKFGSRVDLYLPRGYEPAVNQGDKVKAGESILARKTANKNEHDQGTQA
ncbi:MAG: phosphatidylserine decarboxylase, partial [Desulfonatronovibrionaceae bacterium]